MAKTYSTDSRTKFFHDRLMSIFDEIDSVVNQLIDLRASALDVLHDSRCFLESQNDLENLPEGYERVSVVITKYKAFVVRKWAEGSAKKLM